jgi:hypothetical protein
MLCCTDRRTRRRERRQCSSEPRRRWSRSARQLLDMARSGLPLPRRGWRAPTSRCVLFAARCCRRTRAAYDRLCCLLTRRCGLLAAVLSLRCAQLVRETKETETAVEARREAAVAARAQTAGRFAEERVEAARARRDEAAAKLRVRRLSRRTSSVCAFRVVRSACTALCSVLLSPLGLRNKPLLLSCVAAAMVAV